MASKAMRRIAADVGSLHTAGLPPNYLFPPNASDADLTSLDVLLAGPPGTPYEKGLWRLHLEIPLNYPNAPPTATFRTLLWHPNIDESSGAVCVETLKRDWSSSLKLRDVLVTISCLLIQPNPASALNEAAGKLASEDWDVFCRRAKLMTEVHAPVPKDLLNEVQEAQMRGEDKETKASSAGRHATKATSSAVAKMQQSSAEDEENNRRRGDTVEPESDPESDWIPGPVNVNVKSPGAFSAGSGRDNIFGIKGLDETMQIDSPPKRIMSTGMKGNQQQTEEPEGSDPFITVSPKRKAQQSFSLRLPQASSSFAPEISSLHSPHLTKFTHPNPFLAIQADKQSHPLSTEFSWSWQESQVLHDGGTIKDGTTKSEIRKRMASDEYEERRKWEMKKFKKTGFDLSRYNRGDFGPRTGIARL